MPCIKYITHNNCFLYSYKFKSGCLKGLKTEIEHLQLLHEKLKVKLQKDFENWWTQEGNSLQVCFFFVHNM